MALQEVLFYTWVGIHSGEVLRKCKYFILPSVLYQEDGTLSMSLREKSIFRMKSNFKCGNIHSVFQVLRGHGVGHLKSTGEIATRRSSFEVWIGAASGARKHSVTVWVLMFIYFLSASLCFPIHFLLLSQVWDFALLETCALLTFAVFPWFVSLQEIIVLIHDTLAKQISF